MAYFEESDGSIGMILALPSYEKKPRWRQNESQVVCDFTKAFSLLTSNLMYPKHMKKLSDCPNSLLKKHCSDDTTKFVFVTLHER